jgi:hypothetical protein
MPFPQEEPSQEPDAALIVVSNEDLSRRSHGNANLQNRGRSGQAERGGLR